MQAFDPTKFMTQYVCPMKQLMERYPDQVRDGVHHGYWGKVDRVFSHKGRDLSVVRMKDGHRVMVSNTMDGSCKYCVADLLDEEMSMKEIKEALDDGVRTSEIFGEGYFVSPERPDLISQALNAC